MLVRVLVCMITHGQVFHEEEGKEGNIITSVILINGSIGVLTVRNVMYRIGIS